MAPAPEPGSLRVTVPTRMMEPGAPGEPIRGSRTARPRGLRMTRPPAQPAVPVALPTPRGARVPTGRPRFSPRLRRVARFVHSQSGGQSVSQTASDRGLGPDRLPDWISTTVRPASTNRALMSRNRRAVPPGVRARLALTGGNHVDHSLHRSSRHGARRCGLGTLAIRLLELVSHGRHPVGRSGALLHGPLELRHVALSPAPTSGPGWPTCFSRFRARASERQRMGGERVSGVPEAC